MIPREELVKQLERHTWKEVCEENAISISTLAIWIKKYNLNKPTNKGRRISEDSANRIRELYEGRSCQEVADIMGMDIKTIQRYVKRMGIKRNSDEQYELASRVSKQTQNRIRLGLLPKPKIVKHDGQFKKGQSMKERMGEEKFKAVIKKIQDKRRQTLRKERRRIEWGLPQKTKVLIGRMPKEKQALRSYCRKLKYITLRGENGIIYYNENTRRSEYIEERGEKEFKVKFEEYEG